MEDLRKRGSPTGKDTSSAARKNTRAPLLRFIWWAQ